MKWKKELDVNLGNVIEAKRSLHFELTGPSMQMLRDSDFDKNDVWFLNKTPLAPVVQKEKKKKINDQVVFCTAALSAMAEQVSSPSGQMLKASPDTSS